jgi:hypothetical protein
MEGTPEEIAERQKSAALDLAATQKAAAILRKGGPNAYDQSPAGADSRIARLVG